MASLHLPGHPVIAVAVKTMIKLRNCSYTEKTVMKHFAILHNSIKIKIIKQNSREGSNM
jgi:hypothetical protein